MSGNSSPKYFESSYVSEVKVVGSWIYLQKTPSLLLSILIGLNINLVIFNVMKKGFFLENVYSRILYMWDYVYK